MSEKYIYTPDIEAPDLRSKREKVDDLKKALQESRRIVVNQNFSLSTALAILPEWVRDIIETGITVYDFIDSRLIVDGQWIKIRFINFRWNWKILTGLISSIIRIYKTWTTSLDLESADLKYELRDSDDRVVFKTHKIATPDAKG